MSKDKLFKKGKTVIVGGDLTVDWFEISTPPRIFCGPSEQMRYNWQAYPGFTRRAYPGGALLLAEFLKHTCEANIVGPELEPDNISPGSVIQFFASLDRYPLTTSGGGKSVYRLREWKGISGPGSYRARPAGKLPAQADLVVFDDAGNGFRDERSAWENLLPPTGIPVIHKMSRPLGRGKLWDELAGRDNPLLLVVEADDLRMIDVKISRCLSWERTAQDLAWQMAYNRNIRFLHRAEYLVIRFGAEGVIVYEHGSEGGRPRLYFDPKVGEEGLGALYPGSMPGMGNVFTAGLAAGLLEELNGERIGAAVKQGLSCMNKLWRHGFGSDIEKLDYPHAGIFAPPGEGDPAIAGADIPSTTPEPDRVYWSILEELPAFVEMIAVNSVISGKDDSLERVPEGRYGNLVTLDRSEIESFNSIKNLVTEYLSSSSVKRPLNIGVFGPPGSGKSFGVTEVVKSIDPEKVPKEPLEFNLSQFRSPAELVTAFHKVRDVALQGVVPLVFFDEFDSELNGEKLGWLKYFLAPMQDGLFRDGEVLHPIGKAVFVFAGGTRSTYEKFSKQETSQAFKDAKGSDFVSRLRGYINIKGPNPVGGDLRRDRMAMIRRSTVLRFLLRKHAPGIFRGGKICDIDSGVLQAFIKVPAYKHGIRSMQSIIEMSSLAGRTRYEQAALPSPDQLKLHVDADAFQKIVVREVILSAARERIAKEIHENYRLSHQGRKDLKDPSMLPWLDLPEELRISNLGQADHILEKLHAVNCDFIPVTDRRIEDFSFGPEELEVMAELEHERFIKEKIHQGWVQGPARDNRKKIRTDLLPWADLPGEIREFDRNLIRAIPELLAKAGLEIYRLQ